MDFKDKNHNNDKKCDSKCIQSLPVLAGAFAAALSEGKSVDELRTLALFLAAVANNVFLIASVTDRSKFNFEEIEIL